MRIALLGNSLLRQDLLKRYLPFPYEPVAANGERSRVDVVISRVFGSAEAARFDYTLLQVPGAGIDGIELEALAPERCLCNVYEHEAPIAEYVMATILEHAIGIGEMSRTFQPERWGEIYARRANHREIAGTTLGMIGFGHIGRALAVRAAAFGMRVHAITSGRTHPEGIDWSGGPERLDEMLRVADYIVVACPLDERTRGMIAAPELSLMKPHAVLINVARAEVVVEEDLYRALESKRQTQAGRPAGRLVPPIRHPPATGSLPLGFRFTSCRTCFAPLMPAPSPRSCGSGASKPWPRTSCGCTTDGRCKTS